MPDTLDRNLLGTTLQDDFLKLKFSIITGSGDVLDDNSLKRLDRLLNDQQQCHLIIEFVLLFIRSGRVIRRKALICALAYAISHTTGANTCVRQIYSSFSDVLHNPSDLFQLLQFEAQYSKRKVRTGRSKRKAINMWYNDKTPMNLAYLVTKYRRRCGWSHHDLLRVAHVKPATEGLIRKKFI